MFSLAISEGLGKMGQISHFSLVIFATRSEYETILSAVFGCATVQRKAGQ